MWTLTYRVESTSSSFVYPLIQILQQPLIILQIYVSHYCFNSIFQFSQIFCLPPIWVDESLQMRPESLNWPQLWRVWRIEMLLDVIDVQLTEDINCSCCCVTWCEIRPKPILAIRVVCVNEWFDHSANHPFAVVLAINVLFRWKDDEGRGATRRN